ncbi:MAG: alpha/beta fold hydrolase, partial [Candidatus Eremiobacteraeota bacterium]|nr:alpha/beta fold hydrolase [Candidatus Eremiobacteraeota bacterium]
MSSDGAIRTGMAFGMNLAGPLAWRERTIVAHGARLAVFEAGSAEPGAPCVLLLHGLGHWSDAAWGAVVPLLDPSARYVALDLPGFGASEKPRAAYDLNYFRDVLDDTIAQLVPERFALIGHSLGGFLAADYAGREPGRVERLALIAPAGFGRAPRHLVYALAGGFARWAFTRPPSRRLVQRALLRSVADPASLDDAIVERAHALAQERPVREAFASIYAGALRVFANAGALQAGFARYHHAVLCIWGERDRYLSVRGTREVARVYPNARTLVLPETGHLPMIERPAETGEALKTFLRGFVRGRARAAVVLAIAAEPPHGVLFLER